MKASHHSKQNPIEECMSIFTSSALRLGLNILHKKAKVLNEYDAANNEEDELVGNGTEEQEAAGSSRNPTTQAYLADKPPIPQVSERESAVPSETVASLQ